MKKLLQLEELAQLLLGIYLFTALPFTWWWFIALLLVPDLSMIAYLVNAKWGAWLYNFAHHKGTAIVVYFLGIYTLSPGIQLAGIILFSHASMDRIMGYGLKYTDSFQHTHLGMIGKKQNT